ncbi:MAG: transposase [Planctomycetes bacterium]|nr:transposase [Planctomycetota bacterium]
MIVDEYESLMRARRRKAQGWDKPTRRAYSRHRWRVEGVHGEAKTRYGLGRAARRGLVNMAIQSYLTAAVMNLKRLTALQLGILRQVCSDVGDLTSAGNCQNPLTRVIVQSRSRIRKAA